MTYGYYDIISSRYITLPLVAALTSSESADRGRSIIQVRASVCK